MICLICRQAETVDGLTSVHFERGEIQLVVNRVPVRICPSCGDAYVEEQVAVSLLWGAEMMSAAGEMNGVIEYQNSLHSGRASAGYSRNQRRPARVRHRYLRDTRFRVLRLHVREQFSGHHRRRRANQRTILVQHPT